MVEVRPINAAATGHDRAPFPRQNTPGSAPAGWRTYQVAGFSAEYPEPPRIEAGFHHAALDRAGCRWWAERFAPSPLQGRFVPAVGIGSQASSEALLRRRFSTGQILRSRGVAADLVKGTEITARSPAGWLIRAQAFVLAAFLAFTAEVSCPPGAAGAVDDAEVDRFFASFRITDVSTPVYRSPAGRWTRIGFYGDGGPNQWTQYINRDATASFPDGIRQVYFRRVYSTPTTERYSRLDEETQLPIFGEDSHDTYEFVAWVDCKARTFARVVSARFLLGRPGRTSSTPPRFGPVVPGTAGGDQVEEACR